MGKPRDLNHPEERRISRGPPRAITTVFSITASFESPLKCAPGSNFFCVDPPYLAKSIMTYGLR